MRKPFCRSAATKSPIRKQRAAWSTTAAMIEDITRKLRDSGVADIQGLRPTHGWYTAGRYLRLHEKFGLWLGIELEVWSDAGITPLWAMLDNGDFSGVAGHHQSIRGLFDDAQLYEDDGLLYIPIHLRTGVERDRGYRRSHRTDSPTCRHAAGQVSRQLIPGFGGEADSASGAGNGIAVHSSTMLKRSGCRVGFVPRLPPSCPLARPHAWHEPNRHSTLRPTSCPRAPTRGTLSTPARSITNPAGDTHPRVPEILFISFLYKMTSGIYCNLFIREKE